MNIGIVNGIRNGHFPTEPAPAADPGRAAVLKAAEGAPPPPERREAPKEDIAATVGKLNELFLIFDKSVKFQVDRSSGDIRVKIIDNASQEVIREYPPERVVDILRRIREAVGVLVDEKA